MGAKIWPLGILLSMDLAIVMHNVPALILSMGKLKAFPDSFPKEHVVLNLISGNPTVEPHQWLDTHAISQVYILVKMMLNVDEVKPLGFVKVVAQITILLTKE